MDAVKTQKKRKPRVRLAKSLLKYNQKNISRNEFYIKFLAILSWSNFQFLNQLECLATLTSFSLSFIRLI